MDNPIEQFGYLRGGAMRHGKGFRWAIRIAVALAVIAAVFGAVLFHIYKLYPTTSPWKAISYMNYRRTHPRQDVGRIAMGFMPYWQLKNVDSVRLDLLNEVIYFSLTADEQGNIAAKNAKGDEDPGFAAWNGEAANDFLAKSQIMGARTGVAVAFLKDDRINDFLSSDSSQERFIGLIIGEIRRKHLKIVNLDFEYTGESPEDMPGKFTAFVSRMRQELDLAVPGTEIDLDLGARSGCDPKLFEIANLSSLVNYFMVMSYDYYTPGSDSAGPVAPISGFSDNKYFFDLTATYDDLAKLLPSEKIIMGVPHYGYDWPVKDKTNPRSLALGQSDENGYAVTLSYGRAQGDPRYSGDGCRFDDTAQETWCGYVDSETGKDHVAWLEDARSVKVKYEFAKNRGFAGIGIWALGYDGGYPGLWDVMKDAFTK